MKPLSPQPLDASGGAQNRQRKGGPLSPRDNAFIANRENPREPPTRGEGLAPPSFQMGKRVTSPDVTEMQQQQQNMLSQSQPAKLNNNTGQHTRTDPNHNSMVKRNSENSAVPPVQPKLTRSFPDISSVKPIQSPQQPGGQLRSSNDNPPLSPSASPNPGSPTAKTVVVRQANPGPGDGNRPIQVQARIVRQAPPNANGPQGQPVVVNANVMRKSTENNHALLQQAGLTGPPIKTVTIPSQQHVNNSNVTLQPASQPATLAQRAPSLEEEHEATEANSNSATNASSDSSSAVNDNQFDDLSADLDSFQRFVESQLFPGASDDANATQESVAPEHQPAPQQPTTATPLAQTSPRQHAVRQPAYAIDLEKRESSELPEKSKSGRAMTGFGRERAGGIGGGANERGSYERVSVEGEQGSSSNTNTNTNAASQTSFPVILSPRDKGRGNWGAATVREKGANRDKFILGNNAFIPPNSASGDLAQASSSVTVNSASDSPPVTLAMFEPIAIPEEELKRFNWSGWLSKKGKFKSAKSYYAISQGVLYWFDRPVQPTNDLQRMARGSLNLKICTKFMRSQSKVMLITSQQEIALIAEDENEAISFYNAMYDACVQLKKEGGHSISELKAGYLMKKGQYRYFVLRPGELSWFVNRDSVRPAGSLDLCTCVCDSKCTESNSWSIITTQKSTPYILTSMEGPEVAADWIRVLRQAIDDCKANQQTKVLEIQKSLETNQIHSTSRHAPVELNGFLEIGGRYRYVSVTRNLVHWYKHDPSVDQADTEMLGCALLTHVRETALVGVSIHINTFQQNSSVTLVATNAEEAKRWIDELQLRVLMAQKRARKPLGIPLTYKHAGWVVKKYIGDKKLHRRYLVLEQNEFVVKYYESDQALGGSPKGDIPLFGSSVNQLDETNFVISTGHGRHFPFQTYKREETQFWMSCLAYQIVEANKSLNQFFIKHEWMVGGRAGAPRFICITRDRNLLWAPQVLYPSAEVVQQHMSTSNCLNLGGAKIEKIPDRAASFRICGEGNEWIPFFPNTEESYQEWFTQLSELTKGSGPIVSARLYFGKRLEEVLALESNTTQIPELVRRCCDFVEINGICQGIFRLSGAQSDIQRFTNFMDMGPQPGYPYELVIPPHTDVHTVTGLLKSFLRELANPLLPQELYTDILSCHSIQELKVVLEDMPPVHYQLAKYLFAFLHKLSAQSEITSMDASNLAIVIGPNVLRSANSDDPIQRFKDTPMVLFIVKMLIKEYEYIFDR